MARSRATLAMTEAAAMEGHFASPSMTVISAQPSPAFLLPSMRQRCGCAASPATARRMASRLAWRILWASISSTEATPMDQRTSSCVQRTSWSSSRCARGRSFESLRCLCRKPSGKIAAAAKTGPAQQPRPTSSTPAITVADSWRRLRSNFQVSDVRRRAMRYLALSGHRPAIKY